MDLLNWYVNDELARLEREHPSKAAAHRAHWLAERARRPARRRAAAGRLGDYLVALGEALRAWSAAGSTPPISLPNNRGI